jgi:hypothetical protein
MPPPRNLGHEVNNLGSDTDKEQYHRILESNIGGMHDEYWPCSDAINKMPATIFIEFLEKNRHARVFHKILFYVSLLNPFLCQVSGLKTEHTTMRISLKQCTWADWKL